MVSSTDPHRSRFPLLKYFSITSAVALLLAIASVTALYRHTTVNNLIDQNQKSNVALTQVLANTIWPDFHEHVGTVGNLSSQALIEHPETSRLRSMILREIGGLSVVKVKIYDPNGRTIFSTEAAQIGQDKSTNAGFLAARAGGVASELTHRDSFSAFEGMIEDRDVLSSYVPIIGAGGQVEGVFEIYDDVTVLLADITSSQRLVMAAGIALFVALYAALYLIVRRAERILVGQHQRLADNRDELASKNTALAQEMAERQRVADELKALTENLEEHVEERTAALHAAQEQLVRKERLATVGQLVATVSHELRSPIVAIRNSFLAIADLTRSAGVDAEAPMARAQHSVDRCEGIIGELLDYSRCGPLNLSATNVDAWLGQVLDELSVPDGITVHREFDTNGAAVPLDAEQLRRVVCNLYDNACQAMLDHAAGYDNIERRLTIRTGVDSSRLLIEFADTGPGIPEGVLPSVFEPLFTTKSSNVGLGLSTVKRIVEQHRGTVEITSGDIRCTRVQVSIPHPNSQEIAA